MPERIRIKVGELELEWESDGSLSVENVTSLLREIETLSPAPLQTPAPPRPPVLPNANGAGAGLGEPQKLFVTSIAAKLSVKNGPDLARAAAAYLQITEAKESFSRTELLEAMRKAPMYFKTNMRKNLSPIISGLIPEKFNQIGENRFSLTASEHAVLEAALA
jgi:hypothetical protein